MSIRRLIGVGCWMAGLACSPCPVPACRRSINKNSWSGDRATFQIQQLTPMAFVETWGDPYTHQEVHTFSAWDGRLIPQARPRWGSLQGETGLAAGDALFSRMPIVGTTWFSRGRARVPGEAMTAEKVHAGGKTWKYESQFKTRLESSPAPLKSSSIRMLWCLRSPQRPLNICMVASEVVPLAKTGGLADVVGRTRRRVCLAGATSPGTPPHIDKWICTGRDGGCVQPLDSNGRSVPGRSDSTDTRSSLCRCQGWGACVSLSSDMIRFSPGQASMEGSTIPDNLERFVLFCRSVMELLLHLGEAGQWHTDLLHLHDWQRHCVRSICGPLSHMRCKFPDPSVLLTIHNLGYPGLFFPEQFAVTGLPSSHLFSPAALGNLRTVNVLKGGLVRRSSDDGQPDLQSRETTPNTGCGLKVITSERPSCRE